MTAFKLNWLSALDYKLTTTLALQSTINSLSYRITCRC